MSKPAIIVKNLHKEFLLPQHKKTSMKELFVGMFKREQKVKQVVLDGVDLTVEKGDFFGIVGRNGSGKSTLLKILAGVYTPTVGSVEMHGKLTPFIELGVGFNPELSGRDNVYLNGALLGFTHKQMEEMYDEIVDFAELAPFMDQKLKNYSSGMQVRLAFSIAIKAKNDILIFDEVLAVGDEAFQRKCLDVFEGYKAEKQTVILVTHDMETVRQYCNKAILISEGKIVTEGDPQRVADEYSRLNQKQIDNELARTNKSKEANIKLRTLDHESRQAKGSFETGETLLIDLEWFQNEAIDSVVVDVFRMSGEHVTGFKSTKDGVKNMGSKSHATILLKADLSPGAYSFYVSLRDRDDKEIETVYQVGRFTMIKNWKTAGRAWSGMVPLDHEWVEVD